MKHSIFTLFCCLPLGLLFAQKSTADLFAKMSQTYDQFNDTFDPESTTDQLTIIYIPGSNDPFGKIYDKHKGKKLASDTQYIGGFKEIMAGIAEKKKKEHLQEAFVSRYGKDHFTILLDLESEIGASLDIKGYTILEVSKKGEKIIHFEDFGFDRVAFFKALNGYFK